MFTLATGDLIGLPTNDKHLNFEWDGPARILFSATRRGDALSCHVASDKKGLRYLKDVIDSFCLWAFSEFEWCKMILAVTGRRSIEKLIEKVGFSLVADFDDKNVYMRVRAWVL